MDNIKKWLAPPIFEDEDKTRTARMLNTILLAIVVLVGTLIVSRIISGNPNDPVVIVTGALLVVIVMLLVAMRRGYVKAAAFVLISVSWVLLMYLAWLDDGILDIAFLAVIVVILMANLLLGWRVGVGFAVLSILAAWGLAYAQDSGLVAPDADPVYNSAIDLSVVLGLVAVVMALSTIGLSNALRQARRSGESLLTSNRELQAIQENLEERVASRTRRFEIVASLSERLTAILDQEELLVEVTNLVQDRFGYYHVLLYQVDAERQNLSLIVTAGERGAEMTEQGHIIPIEAPVSLIARAARTQQVVTVGDVRQVPDFLPHPLLPNTLSEMAVPILVDGEVVGVLDVQEDRVDALDEGDAGLLRTLANQVAVVIRNARLFDEVETALEQANRAREQYLIQSWIRTEQGAREKVYVEPDASYLDEAIVTQASQKALQQQEPVIMDVSDEQSSVRSIVAPVTLAGKTIGALQAYRDGEDSQSWSEDDLSFVQTILNQVAQTAENLRLFEETQERAGREATIREITDKLRAAPDMDSLLETAARELGSHLGVQRTVLEFGTESENSPSGNGDRP